MRAKPWGAIRTDHGSTRSVTPLPAVRQRVVPLEKRTRYRVFQTADFGCTFSFVISCYEIIETEMSVYNIGVSLHIISIQVVDLALALVTPDLI